MLAIQDSRLGEGAATVGSEGYNYEPDGRIYISISTLHGLCMGGRVNCAVRTSRPMTCSAGPPPLRKAPSDHGAHSGAMDGWLVGLSCPYVSRAVRCA